MTDLTVESFNPAKPQTYSNAGTVSLGDINIDDTQLAGGSIVSIGTLTYSGEARIGNTFLAGPTTVTVTHMTGFASSLPFLFLDGGMTTSYQTTLNVTGDNAPTTFRGDLSITGNALLEFAGGSITGIDSDAFFRLIGAGARIAVASDTTTSSALSTLSSNASGSFELDNGASVVTVSGTAFSNTGTIALDVGGTGGSVLSIGGVLTNAGFVGLGSNPEDSTSPIVKSDLVTAASLINNNSIELDGGSSDSVVARVAISGTFHNAGDLDFDSGHAVLTHGATFTNMGTVRDTNDTVAEIDGGGGLLNSGTIDLEGTSTILADDRRITDTATGMIDVAQGSISAPKITVQGYMHAIGSVTGNVSVEGGSFGESFLHAPGTLSITGNLKLEADATLETTLVASGTGTAGEIEVSGKASLSGATLRLNIADPQDLSYGEVFTVLTAGETRGKFGFIQAGSLIASGRELDLGDGHLLDVQYDKADGVVQVAVMHSHAAASEPGASLAPHEDTTAIANMPLGHGADWV